MKVFVADKTSDPHILQRFLSSLNLDISDIVYVNEYNDCNSINSYARHNNISYGELFDDTLEEIVASANTFIILWDGKDRKTKDLIREINIACKDCYIYRVDINKTFYCIQQTIDFGF